MSRRSDVDPRCAAACLQSSKETHACVVVLLWTCVEIWHEREEIVEQSHYFCFLCTQIVFSYLHKLRLNTDVTWAILTMSLLPFWVLNVSVALRSMQDQKALRFIKISYFVSDERSLTGLVWREGEDFSFGLTPCCLSVISLAKVVIQHLYAESVSEAKGARKASIIPSKVDCITPVSLLVFLPFLPQGR